MSDHFSSLFNKLSKFFAVGAIFTIPFNRYFLLLEPIWGRGFHNPYLGGQLYVFEVFIVLYLLSKTCTGVSKFSWLKKLSPYAILAVLGSFCLLWLSPAELSVKLFLSLKTGAYLLFFSAIFREKFKLQIFQFLLVSILFQMLLGVAQFAIQGSLGLQFLGEPILSSVSTHLAKLELFGLDLIRPYGSFTHPNVFAAFCLIPLLLWSAELGKKSKTLDLVFYAITFITLVLTGSRLVLLSLALGLALLFFRGGNSKKLWGLSVLALLAFVGARSFLSMDHSLSERLFYMEDFIALVREHAVLGAGFKQSTLVLDSVDIWRAPWMYQPVHSSSFLFLLEFGLIYGSILLFLLFKRIWSMRKFTLPFAIAVSFLFHAQFEHFYLSLDQGLALMGLLFILVLSLESQDFRSKDLLPSKLFFPLVEGFQALKLRLNSQQ